MVSSRKEIRDAVLNTTRQDNAQIGSLVNDFINITLCEINDPGWAFNQKNFNHLWSWLRRKTTFTTVASTEEYVLPRDVDHIMLLRQTSSPADLLQLSDRQFYHLVPNPTSTGNPRYYRIWENEGVAVRLAAADTIDAVSSSSSDAGSAELAVSVMGTQAGMPMTEELALNGTTAVLGTKSFDARELFISKQKDTTGVITIKEHSGGTTLLTLGPHERSPRFKVVCLYPIPSGVLTLYVEYFTTIRQLTNDSDSPQFNEKWHYIVRLGALAKTYQYLNKLDEFQTTQLLFTNGVRAMVAADRTEPDLIEHLEPRRDFFPIFYQTRADEIT